MRSSETVAETSLALSGSGPPAVNHFMCLRVCLGRRGQERAWGEGEGVSPTAAEMERHITRLDSQLPDMVI